MRTLLYFIAVLLLIFGTIKNCTNVGDNLSFSEIPFLSSYLSLEEMPSATPTDKEPNIANNDEWEEILLGKWRYETIIYDMKRKSIITGKVEYLSDGNFSREVSFKSYNSRSKLYFQSGGKVYGTWKVNQDSTWIENIDKCTIEPRYGDKEFDTCAEKYDGENIYGIKESGIFNFEFLVFNDSEINIAAKDLADELTDSYVFTRLEK